MIYQCYFRTEQTSRLFNLPLYRPFGLEPEVNPEIVRCPLLATPRMRLQVLEHAAFLWHLHHPPDDGHGWIGYTSYRQLDKTPWLWGDDEDSRIRELLGQHDALAWLPYEFPVSIARQAEQCHPGILAFMYRLLTATGHDPDQFPPAWLHRNDGCFANYWIMSREAFRLYARDWIQPAIQYVADHLDRDPYLLRHPKAASYALERLFLVWAQGRRVWTPPVDN